MLWRDAVKFRAAGVALLFEGRDEDMLTRGPLAFWHELRARLYVVEHVLDSLHVGELMIKLRHRRPDGMRVRINQTGQNHLACEVKDLRVLAIILEYLLVFADLQDAPVFDRDRLPNGELIVNGDDFSIVKNQVGVSAAKAPAKETQ